MHKPTHLVDPFGIDMHMTGRASTYPSAIAIDTRHAHCPEEAAFSYAPCVDEGPRDGAQRSSEMELSRYAEGFIFI